MLSSQITLTDLVAHREWVPATMTLENVFLRFSEHALEFMAVLDGENCLGICSRETVSMILGTLYGRACFAREAIVKHLQKAALCISTDQSLTDILHMVSARKGGDFFEDVLLTDQKGRFLGLITTQRLIELQHQMLEEYIEKLELSNHQLDRHNRQMENDLRLARELQFAILPRRFPELRQVVPPYEMTITFQHRYQPSGAVGGDFFQIMPLDRHRVGIFLCDVMGHGVQAALVTAMVRAALEILQPVAGEPGSLMSVLNQKLVQMLAGSDLGLFATALYLVIDCRQEQLAFAAAGHPPGFHMDARAQSVRSLFDSRDDVGPPIGIIPDAAYVTLTHMQATAPGDTLLLFTDGLYEVFDDAGEQLGYEGLRAIFRDQGPLPLGRMLDGTLEAINRYTKGRGLNDDVCLLGFQWD